MGDSTAISWCDHTFNIWWGCEHAERSPGSSLTAPECDACYAQSFDHRLGGGHWGSGAEPRWFGDAYWAKPHRWNAVAALAGKRARVFCSSMADWAQRHRDPAINAKMDAARARLWSLIRITPHLDWMLLTKRIDRAAEFLPWLSTMVAPWLNVWIGTTCGARSSLWRIAELRKIPAMVHFVSGEPLLDDISAAEWDRALGGDGAKVDLLIIGDESGPQRRPAHLDSVRTARDAAVRHGVAFHFKQWNSDGKVHLPLLDGVQHAEMPESR